MVFITVAALFVIRGYGETLAAPPPASSGTFAHLTAKAPDILLPVLLALAAVIVLGQLLARVFVYLGQPPVIGEVVAGILLGPSFLGAEASALILAPDAAPHLGVIAQLGVVLYMFLVGLELNGQQLKEHAHTSVVVSHASILLPLVLGALLALPLYPRLSSSDVPFTSFALFMGVAMSITAFPVLARILTDRGLHKTNLGVIALTCAAADDVTAWCLLAFVVGVAQAEVGGGLIVLLGAVAYLAIMMFLVRPLARRVARHFDAEPLSRGAVAMVFVALLLSTLATEFIGIHAIFGAFLVGAVIPHDSAIARVFTRRLGDLVTIFFLPAFFALTGMRTRIDLVSGVDEWLICGVIIVVATLGKFGGTFATGRLTGLGWRDVAALGMLMNTRGLMELIVLHIGLNLGVISPTLFAMMVVMALVTTMTTSPVLRLLMTEAAKDGDAERETRVAA